MLLYTHRTDEDVDKPIWSLHNSEASEGLLISIRRVGQRLEKGKLLAAERVFEDVLENSDTE